jgi:hypothetical protein
LKNFVQKVLTIKSMSSPKTLQLNWVTTADRGLGGIDEFVDELVEVEGVDET